MKIKIKRTGNVCEVAELIVINEDCVAPQRVDVQDVEFLPEEFIKYLLRKEGKEKK